MYRLTHKYRLRPTRQKTRTQIQSLTLMRIMEIRWLH